MLPHDGAGGRWPRPRKARLASANTAIAIVSVACTTIGASTFGSTWPVTMAEMAEALRTRGGDVVLGADDEGLRAGDADEDRHRRDADGDHGVLQARPQERGERDGQHQERTGQAAASARREDRHVDQAAETIAAVRLSGSPITTATVTEMTPAASEARLP